MLCLPIHKRARFRSAVLTAMLAALAGCGGDDESAQMMPPTPVNVAEIQLRDVTSWTGFSGRIEAVNSVELRPRVSGYLDGVHFVEGGRVKAGDLLFTIDDREFRAAVDSASADLQRARARLALAEQEFSRSEKLLAARAVSEQELEQRRGELMQARADQQAANARLQRAQLDLEFTRVTAPIDGVVGSALVRPGNLVAAGSTLLSTLVSVDPVYVSFEGDERTYQAYLGQLDGSERSAGNDVLVGLANETGYPHRGVLDFVDNQLDPATGAFRARATLPNPDGRLVPGMFARVRMLDAESQSRLLVHEQAVLTDQDRRYVYVADENNTAQRRDVVLGGSIEGLRIVESGLQAGDRVVVSGMLKIFFPGAPLMPNPVPMDQPDMAPAASGDPAAQN